MVLYSKDLMIGDWVHDGLGEKGRIESLKCGQFGGDQAFRVGKDKFVMLSGAYPIELTPKILEKNGFVYNDMPFVQAWEGYCLSIYGDGLINCGQNVAMQVKYVHQLQHVLRLCGIEKEIEL